MNKTDKYHKEALNTLGWELTICNSLYPERTVLRKKLINNESFGKLLYCHLNKFIPMNKIENILEIGGGYGYIMKDFLEINASIKPTMVDISPFLLNKQKETLQEYNVTFIEGDFLHMNETHLKNIDLAIMNENLGDFPTVVGLKRNMFTNFDSNDVIIKKAERFFNEYGFTLPEEDTFNFNIGAVEAIEKLCKAGITYIYAGEHSCEASPPDNLKLYIEFEPTGNPEKISLMGHDEYTIKFSYLKRIGEAFGYRVIRGNFADFIKIKLDESVMFSITTKGKYSDEDEIIFQFVEDLFKYEYLLFILD